MTNKRWTADEVHLLINYLSNHLNLYTTGVKERFYEGASDFLAKHNYGKNKKQCKTKCSELKSDYKQYKLKLAQSGFGLQASDPPTIKGQVDSSYSSSSQSHDAAGTDEAADGRHDLAKDGSAAAKPVPSQVSGKGLLGKRALTPAGATTVAGASNLHDALLLIHEEKSQRREKRHKRDSELQEQQLELQKEQLELQREEMRLREK
ncbi:hypothetical protein PHYSODRAFT_327204 [Phytophthora sojae]|uniref:Myb/SANT-like DNA-binding domain-containing protein n=1 Tax=Phytophthora sojae (strain P6497) TaxID=1094619 RepID=G4YZR3_PHYSP|nr:hypothetical protein PHYSODRAFT_327204 [Phytophthora sojae]EGZ26288.1 hypothetical protein PHYSODRAFT_327204 [Phytophthora sojae]|eukprot:XP_009521576.1 hypothetical protein PHYSODRAFT_327204 [Phytophthora sojae]